jgi:hypothetical protein
MKNLIFISNYRDEKERGFLNKKNQEYIELLKVNFLNTHGILITINLTAQELMTKGGIKLAKKIIKNIIFNYQNKTNVFLFAGSTKRIFKNKNGQNTLKILAPNSLFTIGDNGTSILLIESVKRAIKNNNLNKNSKILIVGATGILGTETLKYLYEKGFEDINILTSNITNSISLSNIYPGINAISGYDDIKKVDLIITCTHNKYSLLTTNIISNIKTSNQHLVIVDVAQPSNVSLEVQLQSEKEINYVIAGNGYSTNIIYDKHNMITNQDIGFDNNEIFGCFSEAFVLTNANITEGNFFNINETNIKLIIELFKKYKIIIK